ncbi:MAG: PIG-L deacetylase family protein [Armatimonadota bacterium]
MLAFGCHPDDVEFQCAGTLALLARRGYEIHIATMTGGEMGSPELSPQQIREKRLRECADSAAVIDAHYHCAGGYDIEVDYNPEYWRCAIRIMREVDPAIVFTHAPMDYMIDHEETSRLVRNAAFVATVPNYDCGVPLKPTGKVPHLYYWDAIQGRDIFGRPLPINCIVDISAVLETKKMMLASHASQREWLAYVSGWDEYIETMVQAAHKQGETVGREVAEGFVQHLGASYPQNNMLKDILGDLCVEL